MIQIDQKLISELFDKALVNPRLRQNYDLRTSADDGGQRMLNALMPGTVVLFIITLIVTKMSFSFAESSSRYYSMKKAMRSKEST